MFIIISNYNYVLIQYTNVYQKKKKKKSEDLLYAKSGSGKIKFLKSLIITLENLTN